MTICLSLCSTFIHSSENELQAIHKITAYWKLKKHHQHLNVATKDEKLQDHLIKVNKRLAKQNLSHMMNAIMPYPQAQEINMQQAAITWNRLNDPDLAKTLEFFTKHHVSHIPFHQFMDELKKCCFQLDYLLQQSSTTDYCIIYEKNRSQHWVTNLALRYLYLLPTKEFVFKLNEGGSTQGMKLCKNYVMFDDFSLSGIQITDQVMRRFVDGLENLSESSKEQIEVNLILVIPYMTTKAYKLIKSTIKNIENFSNSDHLKINVKIINSQIIPLISQLPLKANDSENMDKILALYSNKLNWPVVFADWKLPDVMSIPMTFHGVLYYIVDKCTGMRVSDCPKTASMLPEIIPPYKNLTSVLDKQRFSQNN